MFKNTTLFTHRNIGTKSGAYISSSLNIDASQDQHQFPLNLRVEDWNNMDLELDAVTKGFKKKTAKRKMDRLVSTKA